MKSIYLLFMVGILSVSNSLPAQVSINNDGSSPDPSAGLDVNFNNKGVLLPRMTYMQRNAIANPAEGLIVFCTDCNQDGSGLLSVFLGGLWKNFVPECTTPSAPIEGTHVCSENQIIWTWSSTHLALGYKLNWFNDYNTAQDIGLSTTLVDTGLFCGTNYTRFCWAYNACGHSEPAMMTSGTSICSVCGFPITINHTGAAGLCAPFDKTVTYGTVTNIPGEPSKCWISSNLGADNQAYFVDDVTYNAAGWYWQFNQMQGHDYQSSVLPEIWITAINEDSDWLPANDPCAIEIGNGWRLPTSTEWANVNESGGWLNWNGPWNSPLRLHTAGMLWYMNGSWLQYRGIYGYYWSSSQSSLQQGQSLNFSASNSLISTIMDKAKAFPVRCLREQSTQ